MNQFKKIGQKRATYSGNPDGAPIYPNQIDHGYGEPLAGGTDVMRRLQNQLLHEQGTDNLMRPESPRLAARVAARHMAAGEEDSYDDFVAYMDANAVPFPKGTAWWIPGHNFAINVTMMGRVNLWQYTILPLFAEKSKDRVYRSAGGTGEGLVVHPSWIQHHKFAGAYPTIPELAERMIAFAASTPTVSESVKSELKWVETKYHFAVPMEIKTRLMMDAPKTAVRRWGVNRLKLKDIFIPFDGTKPMFVNSSRVDSVVNLYADHK